MVSLLRLPNIAQTCGEMALKPCSPLNQKAIRGITPGLKKWRLNAVRRDCWRWGKEVCRLAVARMKDRSKTWADR